MTKSTLFPPLARSRLPCVQYGLMLTFDRVMQAIQTARMEKELSQKDVAQKINEKPSVIQDYEAGRAIPNPQILSKLERILGVKLRGTSRFSSPLASYDLVDGFDFCLQVLTSERNWGVQRSKRRSWTDPTPYPSLACLCPFVPSSLVPMVPGLWLRWARDVRKLRRVLFRVRAAPLYNVPLDVSIAFVLSCDALDSLTRSTHRSP